MKHWASAMPTAGAFAAPFAQHGGELIGRFVLGRRMPEQGIKVRHGTYPLACCEFLKR
jgi:hypothetical protein